jgi:hypothetical protein
MKKHNRLDLVGEDLLFAASVPVEQNGRCGIYFLFSDGKIVYVGQSVCIENRVRAHYTEDQKEFDSYARVLCDAKDLDVFESAYIIKFQPIYNKTLSFTFGCVSESYIADTMIGGRAKNRMTLTENGYSPEFVFNGQPFYDESCLRLFEMRGRHKKRLAKEGGSL